MSQSTQGRRRDDLVPIAVVLAMLSIPAFLNPGDRLLGVHTQLYLPPCIFQWITGVPCPLCGLTTSFALITHGRAARAFLANPSGPLIYLALVVWLVLSIRAFIAGRRVRTAFRVSGYCLLGMFLGMWALRLAAWFLAGK